MFLEDFCTKWLQNSLVIKVPLFEYFTAVFVVQWWALKTPSFSEGLVWVQMTAKILTSEFNHLPYQKKGNANGVEISNKTAKAPLSQLLGLLEVVSQGFCWGKIGSTNIIIR